MRPLFLVPLSMLGGCTFYSAPSLAVTRAYVSDQSDQGVVLKFDVAAANKNSVDLPLREVRYTVWLDGREVFYGVRSPEATLRRLGTQTITFPAVIKIDEEHPRPQGEQRFVVKGELAYTTPGEFAQALFDVGVRRPKVSFERDGTVEFAPASTQSLYHRRDVLEH